MRYVVRIRRRHGGIVSLGQLRQSLRRDRARNDDETHFAQVFDGTGRKPQPAAMRLNQSSMLVRVWPVNAKVSHGSQSPMTLDLCLSDSAGSRPLDRLVRC